MTKITARPMRMAVSFLLDTPRKGQMPRNMLSTKLLTMAASMNMEERDSVFMVNFSYAFAAVVLRCCSFLRSQLKNRISRPSTKKPPGGSIMMDQGSKLGPNREI